MYKFETKKDIRKVIRAILEGAVLLLVLAAIVKTLWVNRDYIPYDPSDQSIVSGADRGFLAVSYFGVDRQGTDTLISTTQLDEQLGQLHSLGYVTVRQQDIADYYRKGAPLPDKALFLMFEDGRRDTAMFAQKILEKYNFCATILSYADKFEEKDPKFLSRSDLQDLTKGGFWELGTNGYRLSYINAYDRYDRFLGQMTSDEFVRVNEYLGRDYNHYLMDYIRDEDRIPIESKREMESRITQDYRYMESIYGSRLGSVPGLYCLMHSNTGRFGNTAAVSAVNQENIGDLFSMNFNRDGFTLNTKDSSIYDLTRLQPQASWGNNHLLMRVRDDLPEERKSEIQFFAGEAAQQNTPLWDLEEGAVEYRKDRILLTCLPQGEGTLRLKGSDAADLSLSVRLLGNQLGTQSIYLRADEALESYVSVSLEDGVLVISQVEGGISESLFSMDLHDLVPEKDRISIEEDSRSALAAEYTMRGRFAASAADSAVFYSAAQKALQQPARTVAEGAEEYIPELQINTQGDTRLEITLVGATLSVSVDGRDVTGPLTVSPTSGGVVLGSRWGGWGYSQRNVADDVYDAVFKDLTVTSVNTPLYSNRLQGLALVWDRVKTGWNTTLNWFITNL